MAGPGLANELLHLERLIAEFLAGVGVWSSSCSRSGLSISLQWALRTGACEVVARRPRAYTTTRPTRRSVAGPGRLLARDLQAYRESMRLSGRTEASGQTFHIHSYCMLLGCPPDLHAPFIMIGDLNRVIFGSPEESVSRARRWLICDGAVHGVGHSPPKRGSRTVRQLSDPTSSWRFEQVIDPIAQGSRDQKGV